MRRRRTATVLGATALAVASWIAVAACDTSLDLGSSGDAAIRPEGAAGDGALSDGAAPPTCDDVCRKVQACGFVEDGKFAGCLADCQRATPADLACVMSAPCNAIFDCARVPEASTTDGPSATDVFEIGTCQSACDNVEFFDCIDAATHAACRATCETAPRTKRNAFSSCGASGSDCVRLQDCVRVLLGD